MSLPKEPRQLMINLMYLVLTAMLALNVSSEILHAFKTINKSIVQSNGSIAEKNNELYQQFDANMQEDASKARVKPYHDKAQQVKTEAEKLYAYLEEWKKKVIDESGGVEENGDIKREDNIDASTLLLVNQNGGDEIKKKLQAFKEMLITVVENKDFVKKELPINISNPERSDNNPQGDWSTGNFYNMPTLAAVTLFSKLQNDVRNSEAMVVKELFDEAGSKQIKFDAITAIAVPRTSYTLQGQPVQADIMMAAYNKSVNPIVNPNGGSIEKVEGGIAHWKGTANGVGMQTVKGTLTIDLGSHKETKDWSFQYMVGTAGASMQLDKMNVFYIGVPNPITVSAAGYSLEDVIVNVPGAQVTKTANGKYDVRVSQQGEVVATISAKGQDNTVKQVGAQKIRIKYIPDPEAQVGGKSGGGMAASVFRAQAGVVAELKNFEFDARYVVTAFSFSMIKKRDPDQKGPYKVNSPYFSDSKEIQALMAGAKPGDRVFIEDIKAKGPDGRIRPLNSLSFVLF